MNKDFFKVFQLVLMVVIAIGVVGWLLPGCEQGSFKIKKLHWFDRLFAQKDTTEIKVDEVALRETAQLKNEASPLSAFLQKLDSGKANQEVIRIAYYGDSIIEGDLITQQLRANLQERYAGRGIGFMPITSIVAGFRKTIKHEFAKNWESVSFMTKAKSDIGLGVSGFTFIPRNYYTDIKAQNAISDTLADSLATLSAEAEQKTSVRHYVSTNPWVSYQSVKVKGGAESFEQIRLFYSHAQTGSWVKVSFDNNPAITYQLVAGNNLQVLDLTQAQAINKIRLEFSLSDPIHVYGVSFDQKQGVFVDNFSIRGYSGMYFQRIPQQLLSAFNQHLQYDLVVLQYGENVSNPKIKDYSFYVEGMKKTLKHLQSAFPAVPILIVSAHDRAIKSGTEYITSPDIPYLIKAQQQIAAESNCAFFNLYEAMGGKDSMKRFVKQRLASTDFTHFNLAGANRIADLLTEFILGGKQASACYKECHSYHEKHGTEFHLSSWSFTARRHSDAGRNPAFFPSSFL